MTPRLPILFILITMSIDAMGIGLIMPVMPDLIRSVEGGSLSQAAIWGGILTTAFAAMQFLFGPLLGNLSDSVGRRPVLLVSLAVMALDYLIMAVAGSIWLLLLGRIIGGITAATQSAAAAYVADISAPGEKTARFGLISAAFGLGFVIGPVIGGLLGQLGPRAPFYAAAGLATLNLAFGAVALPETVTDRIRRPFSLARANPLGAFRQMRELPGLGRLLLITFLYEFAFYVYPVTWAYFTQVRFGWGPRMIGLSLAAFGLSIVIVQGVLIKRILNRLGEARTVLVGLAISGVAFLFLGVVQNGTLALILTPLTALGAISEPALSGIMSRRAGDDQQGELQGSITSIRAVAVILSPLAMTWIFSAFTRPDAAIMLPGAAFLLSMTLMAVCGLVFVARPRAVSVR